MSIQQTFQTYTDSISGVHGLKSLTVKHLVLPIHKHLMLELCLLNLDQLGQLLQLQRDTVNFTLIS